MEVLNLFAQVLYVVFFFLEKTVESLFLRLTDTLIRVIRSIIDIWNTTQRRFFHITSSLLKNMNKKSHRRGTHTRIWHTTQINFHKNSKKISVISLLKYQLNVWIIRVKQLTEPPESLHNVMIHEPIFARLARWAFPKRFRKKILPKLSAAGMVVTGLILFGLLFPDLALKIIPYKTEPIVSAVDESVLGGKFEDKTLYSKVDLPEKNEYLPTGNWLVIPKIGVRTLINEESYDDHEEALKKGVWRVPDFAEPTQGAKFPMILVAHKFGYLKWSNDFRHKNSFYNLDKLEIGDTFEVIWDQRRFTYEVYAGDQSEEITDYKADVILYTCKYLNSPVRIFRYARRVG